MEMHTQKVTISFLPDRELDAVSGGRFNNGGQQLINKDQRGVPGSGGGDHTQEWSTLVLGGMFVLGTAMIGL
jgi:hypothetical protein